MPDNLMKKAIQNQFSLYVIICLRLIEFVSISKSYPIFEGLVAIVH